MMRIATKLQTASLVICCVLAGCASKNDNGVQTDVLRSGVIQFSPMYSAYDGVHDYQLTPSVPISDPSSKDSDPVMMDTLKWTVDPAYVKMDTWGDLPGAVILTTKKPGTTLVSITAKTKGGLSIRDSAMLTISQADPAQWDMGDARYNNGMMIDWSVVRPMRGGMMDGGASNTCGLPFNFLSNVPKTSACGNCHDDNSGIAVEHTPTQTAGYSNDDLIQIFTQGMKPAGGTFNSPFLKMLPDPDCVYANFHTWDIDDDTKAGIVWKLRSLPPKVQPTVDATRLRPPGAPGGGMGMFMGRMGAAGSGNGNAAAGSGM